MARGRTPRVSRAAVKAVAQDICGFHMEPAGSWSEERDKVYAFVANPDPFARTVASEAARQEALALEAAQGIYDAIPFGERVRFSDGRYGVIDIFYPPRVDPDGVSFGIDVDLFTWDGKHDGHLEFIVSQTGWGSGPVPMENPALEWKTSDSTSDMWATARIPGHLSPYDEVHLSVERDTGKFPLREGGRWYWWATQSQPGVGSANTHSGRGFRTAAAAKRDAEEYAASLGAQNPIEGLPGGTVTKCIAVVKKRKKPPRDPGAYCAAIADRIEPGWRQDNRIRKKAKNSALSKKPKGNPSYFSRDEYAVLDHMTRDWWEMGWEAQDISPTVMRWTKGDDVIAMYPNRVYDRYGPVEVRVNGLAWKDRFYTAREAIESVAELVEGPERTSNPNLARKLKV